MPINSKAFGRLMPWFQDFYLHLQNNTDTDGTMGKTMIVLVLMMLFSFCLFAQGKEGKLKLQSANAQSEDTTMEIKTSTMFRNSFNRIFDDAIYLLERSKPCVANPLRQKNSARFESSWAGLEVGYLNFADFDNRLHNGYKLSGGWRFAWNVFDIEVPFSSRCGLLTGLGYASDVFFAKDADSFSRHLFIESDTREIDTAAFTDVERAKLVVRYLTLPLLFEFQSTKRSFRCQFGLIVGLNLYSRLKTQTATDNLVSKTEYKSSDSFQLNRMKADANLRLSYKHWQLCFAYSLTPLFDTKIHDIVQPYSISINLSF